ncbi:CLUMA_CG007753, isoform A [Clunio marinus]|uniref:CLUMA_CG007753, isoform A n=1 Tax=Clunio marinus TaxID=568069 RepID=A0A1J1I5M7_9DIPT|nr:CLUMA_CG007753, isoform A [Clunio marinus]
MILRECSYNQWKGDSTFDRVYYTYWIKQNVVINDRDAEIEFGQSEEGNQKVQAVTFHNGLIKYIPQAIGKEFQNLAALEIAECGLTEINKDDLKPMPNLKDLWLWENKLKSLPQDLFTYTTRLEIISFKHNDIVLIGKHLLKPLDKLIFADFRGNVNIDRKYEIESNGTLELLKQDIENVCQPETMEYSAVSSYVRELWESKRFSDFTIKVGNKSFKVHKNILGVNSCVFSAMFAHENVNENITNEMEVNDLSPETFEEFLDFIYNRNIPERATNAMDLYAAAVKYQVEDLKKISEEFVLDMLDEKNSWSVLMLANLYDNEFMKVLAFKEVCKLFPDHQISDSLISHPEKVKLLIDAKNKMEWKIAAVRLEMKKLLNEINSDN